MELELTKSRAIIHEMTEKNIKLEKSLADESRQSLKDKIVMEKQVASLGKEVEGLTKKVGFAVI